MQKKNEIDMKNWGIIIRIKLRKLGENEEN